MARTKVIGIHRLDHLANRLSMSVKRLLAIADAPESFITHWMLHDPNPNRRDRVVISVTGPLRKFQDRFLKCILEQHLTPSPFSHGSVKHRSIRSNAECHLGSRFAYSVDIASFYPTIHHKRVYRLLTSFGLSPDVARVCTRLTTYDRHLALGLVTSPILAEAVFQSADRRIAALCNAASLKYSRYVDDICISGAFNLEHSGIPRQVCSILNQHGFRIKRTKELFQRIDEDCHVAGTRIKRTKIDVTKEYLDRLEIDLEEAEVFAKGGPSPQNYQLASQFQGRIRFVSWLNPGRTRTLQTRYQKVDWRTHLQRGNQAGLVSKRKTLTRLFGNLSSA